MNNLEREMAMLHHYYQMVMGWSIPWSTQLMPGRHTRNSLVFRAMNGKLQETIDREMERYKPIAECQDKCNWCCYQPVAISPAEAFMIAGSLDPHLTNEDRIEKRADLMKEREWDRIGADGMFRAGTLCIFNWKKRCGVYANRPTTCRAYFSLSRQKCIIGWESRFLKHIPEGDYIRESQDIALTMQIAFDFTFYRMGLQVNHWELAYAVSVAREPGALDRWLSGEWIFDESRNMIYPDKHGVPRGPYRNLMEVTERQVDLIDVDEFIQMQQEDQG